MGYRDPDGSFKKVQWWLRTAEKYSAHCPEEEAVGFRCVGLNTSRVTPSFQPEYKLLLTFVFPSIKLQTAQRMNPHHVWVKLNRDIHEVLKELNREIKK